MSVLRGGPCPAGVRLAVGRVVDRNTHGTLERRRLRSSCRTASGRLGRRLRPGDPSEPAPRASLAAARMGARPPEPRDWRHPQAARRFVRASHWRSPTPTSSACPTSASRPCTASSTSATRRSANASSCRRSSSCRRCFAPASVSPRLESQWPVADVDVLAFSVSFEWDYTNVLTMLRLAGLPLARGRARPQSPARRSAARRASCNPEPLAPFVDLVCVGEGEVLAPALVAGLCGRRRPQRRSSHDSRGSLASYVPSLVDVRYDPAGRIERLLPRRPARTCASPSRKRSLRATELADPPSTTVFSPDTEFGSRLLIEAVRGCAEPVSVLLGGLQLPARAPLRRSRHPPPGRRGPPVASARGPGVDRPLRSPRDRGDPRELVGLGYHVSPASLRRR